MRGDAGWAGIRHIAHRCGGRLAPENTLDGLRVAATRGFRAVEFDVMLSADGTPVLLHDETLDRTTNGRGALALTGDAELASLFAHRGCEQLFPAARIPRLDQAIELCCQLGLAMNVEIKPAAGTDAETARAVARVLGAASAGHAWGGLPPLVSSFSEAALRVARPLLPELPFALLLDQVAGDWRACFAELGCSALHVAADQSDQAWLEEATTAGVPIRCYTVNTLARAEELFARGVAAVFTDALDVFADAGRPQAGPVGGARIG